MWAQATIRALQNDVPSAEPFIPSLSDCTRLLCQLLSRFHPRRWRSRSLESKLRTLENESALGIDVLSQTVQPVRVRLDSSLFFPSFVSSSPLQVEKQEFGLKPMNCPGHCLMYAHRVRSYRGERRAERRSAQQH